jgi:hypothetical protein
MEEDTGDVMSAAAAAATSPPAPFAGIPFLYTEEQRDAAVTAAIKMKYNSAFPVIAQATNVVFTEKPNSDFHVPEIEFVCKEGDEEKRTSNVLVIESTSAAHFFGDMITKKMTENGEDFYTTKYGKKDRTNSHFSKIERQGQVLARSIRRFDPFDGTSKRDVSYEYNGGDGAQRFILPTPMAAILEALFMVASHKWQTQFQLRLAPVPELALGVEEILAAVQEHDYAFSEKQSGKEGNTVMQQIKDGSIVMKQTHRVTYRGSGIPLIRPVFKELTDMPKFNVSAKIKMKEDLLRDYPDVVSAIFGSPREMDCSNGYPTLYQAAPALRRLLTALKDRITLRGMASFFNGMKADDVYEFSIPPVYNAAGEKLTLRALADLQFDRPEADNWDFLIAAPVHYETWWSKQKNGVSAVIASDKIQILGFVPAVDRGTGSSSKHELLDSGEELSDATVQERLQATKSMTFPVFAVAAALPSSATQQQQQQALPFTQHDAAPSPTEEKTNERKRSLSPQPPSSRKKAKASSGST